MKGEGYGNAIRTWGQANVPERGVWRAFLRPHARPHNVSHLPDGFVPPPVAAAKLKPTWKTNRNVPRHTIVAPRAVEEVGDNETAALESNETAGNDATEIVSEKQDLILELDEDDEVGVNGVVAGEKG